MGVTSAGGGRREKAIAQAQRALSGLRSIGHSLTYRTIKSKNPFNPDIKPMIVKFKPQRLSLTRGELRDGADRRRKYGQNR
jgi:hypothetical protein